MKMFATLLLTLLPIMGCSQDAEYKRFVEACHRGKIDVLDPIIWRQYITDRAHQDDLNNIYQPFVAMSPMNGYDFYSSNFLIAFHETRYPEYGYDKVYPVIEAISKDKKLIAVAVSFGIAFRGSFSMPSQLCTRDYPQAFMQLKREGNRK